MGDIAGARLLWADSRLYVTYCRYDSLGWYPLYIAHSNDRGRTWSAPVLIPAAPAYKSGIAIGQAADGRLIVGYTILNPYPAFYDIYYQSSTDSGTSWLGEQPLAADSGSQSAGSIVRDGAGRLLVFYYSDNYSSPRDTTIYYRASTDNGVTWAPRQRAVGTNSVATSTALFTPGGVLWLTFGRSMTGRGYDIFHAFSTDNGSSWSSPAQVTRYFGYDGVPALIEAGGGVQLYWASDRWANYDVYCGPLTAITDDDPPPALISSSTDPAILGQPFAIKGLCRDGSGIIDVSLRYTIAGQYYPPLTLYDDGNHGDSAAGDGWYGNYIGPVSADHAVEVIYRFKITDIEGHQVLAPLQGSQLMVSGVHDVGDLLMYISPVDGRDGAEGFGYPSCEWPAGSGIDHLFSGHAWVGAVAAGDTLVSDINPNSGQTDWRACDGDTMRWRPEVSDLDSRIIIDDRLPYRGRSVGIRGAKHGLSWHYWQCDDFIIEEYTITNTGVNGNLHGLYVGFCYDFDVQGDGPDDVSAYDPARSMSYMYENSNPVAYVGVRTLSHAPRNHVTWTLSGDPTSDAAMFRMLASDSFMATRTTADDYRILQSVGPFDINAGDSVEVVMGIVAGGTLTELQANADTMKALYDRGYVIGVEEPTADVAGGGFALASAVPNPTAASVRFDFALAQAGPVLLDVIDVVGRRVRLLLDGDQAPGRQTGAWDGCDESGTRVPRGVYYVRLASGGRVARQKLIVGR
jgi:hypothetical protein